MLSRSWNRLYSNMADVAMAAADVQRVYNYLDTCDYEDQSPGNKQSNKS